MKSPYLFLLFIGLVFGKDSESKRLHIIEKYQFYFYYKIETILGGPRTFAPGCEDCDFDKVRLLPTTNMTSSRLRLYQVSQARR
jgi:hypothetical protein